MSKLSRDEQLKIINAIPNSKLDELASHPTALQGSGEGKKGAGFWGDAWSWLKKNGPVIGLHRANTCKGCFTFYY